MISTVWNWQKQPCEKPRLRSIGVKWSREQQELVTPQLASVKGPQATMDFTQYLPSMGEGNYLEVFPGSPGVQHGGVVQQLDVARLQHPVQAQLRAHGQG